MIVFLWFLGFYIYFVVITANLMEAFLILLYFKPHESLMGNFYANLTEFLIFGLVFSLITIELFRKYNPADTSRELAKTYEDHVVIIGYNHIGQRIAEYLRENSSQKIVIVERDKEKVQDLIDCEEAVVCDNALYIDTLKDAAVDKAKAVFVMSDKLELQLVVNANIREVNKDCKIVCRVFQDDIGELISKTYDASVISTSKFAAQTIMDELKRHRYRNVLLIGANHITSRVFTHIKRDLDIEAYLIEENEEIVEDIMISKDSIVFGDPKERSVLEKVNIQTTDLVINTEPDVTSSMLITKQIRELNSSCNIISRFFLESVAEILERPPFKSKVMSSSKETLKTMVEKGMFNF